MESLKLVPRGMYESLRERGLTSQHTKAVRAEVSTTSSQTFTPQSYFLAAAAIDRELLSIEQVANLLNADIVTTRRLLQRFASGGEDILDFQP